MPSTSLTRVACAETWHSTGKAYASDVACRIRRRLAKDKKLSKEQIADVFSFDTEDLKRTMGEALDDLVDLGILKKHKGKDVYIYNL
jgi:hypothetical protein